MDRKVIIQKMYLRAREDSNYDTDTLLSFMKWLHFEKNEARYLEDIQELTAIERSYLDQLLSGQIKK